LAQHLQHDLRIEAYTKVQALEMAWFESKKSGQLLATLNDDINQLERFINSGINSIIQVVCSSIFISIVFFALAPQLAAISLLPVPLILYGTFWFQAKLAPEYAAVREAAGHINSRLNNNLQGISTIKSYTAETWEIARIQESSLAYLQTNASAIRYSSAMTPIIRMAVLMGFVATLVYGGWMTLHGQLAVGSYSVLVYLTQRLLWPMTGLAEIADLYQRSMASIDRVLLLLKTPISIPYEGSAFLSQPVRGDLVFDQLNFHYQAGFPTLKNLNLTIKAGQTIGVVGGTGSGKSTLIKLLLRFYNPVSGHIYVDGIDISSLGLHDLRRVIGYVAQEPFLTDGTVAENIAYGYALDENATSLSRQAIESAALAADAHDFIVALPQGYDTPVGERGMRLSGGQRQRIALARAILKNPAILILDEATSAVDNETEAAIQRSLNAVSANRTTLVIAHRLSTVRHADCIYVLNYGEIVESGTHDVLLAQGGEYAHLWRLQTGELLI
jgi:ATP-binding cassette subfamily B protein